MTGITAYHGTAPVRSRLMRLPVLTLLVGLSFHVMAREPRVVHVLVALCDNVHQGIVKVPTHLGNGQDPAGNLYWGAAFGVRTHFNKAAEWTRVPCDRAPEAHILERVAWRHRDSAVVLIAEAYDGRHIREATEDLLRYASGAGVRTVNVNGEVVRAGGAAHLVAYTGHDGLMDFHLDRDFPGPPSNTREVIILACVSRSYFQEPLRATKATPLLWTTGLMAPEAYTLRAALDGWVRHETAEHVRERAAAAYHNYQKCGIAGARRLLTTGW